MDTMTNSLVPDLNSITDACVAEAALCRKLRRALKGQPVAIALNAVARTMHALQTHLRGQEPKQVDAAVADPA